MTDDTLRKVEGAPSKGSIARLRRITVTLETELYCDLGMYGDDLAFELVFWANREFGVAPNLRISDYGPSEGVFVPVARVLRKLMGRSERQYKSLKVSDVLTAIEAKRWPE